MRIIAIGLIVVVFLLVLSPGAASADRSDFQRGLGVFASFDAQSRVGTLAPGQSAYLVIATDGFYALGPQGMITAQFGVEVDPRLEVVSRFVAPEAFFIFNPTPDEWQLGLQTCIGVGEHPFTLATYEVRLAAGVTDTQDLRVRVRPLTSIGEPMLFGSCQLPDRLERLYDAGGVLLNPSSPGVVHFSCEPDVVVEGRPVTLAWETHGATTVTLDGNTVPAVGKMALTPTAETVYELRAGDGSTEVTATKRVEVIRTPRVEYFQAALFDTGAQVKVQLSWDVRGTSIVSVTGVAGSGYPRDTALVPLTGSQQWDLTASNEWGTTSATATLQGGEEDPPTIVSIAAHPNPFVAGSTVTLDYTLFNATMASIEPDVGPVSPTAGSVPVLPAATTTYTLTAGNANGTVSSGVVVQLQPARIHQFYADPPEVFGGFSTTLRWVVDPGVDLVITPGVGAVSGETGSIEVVPPQFETNYTLTATNAEGTAAAHARTEWLPPAMELTASSTQPFANETVTLSARLEGAFSATLEPGFGSIDPAGGDFPVIVTEPTTFVLSATNAFDTRSVSVTLTPRAPLVALEAPKLNPFPGEEVPLTATIQGADAATLEPGFGDIDPGGGVFPVAVTEPTTFVLTATNAAGTSSADLTLTPGAPTLDLSVDATDVAWGETVHLTATIDGADWATLEPGFGAIDPGGDVFAAAIESTTTFVLTAGNASATASDAVTVTLRPPVAGLAASTLTPFPGETVLLTATLEGAVTATLEPGIGAIDPAGGVFPVTVSQPTTFVLSATNPTATVTAEVVLTPRPPSAQLAASASSVFAGEPVTLTATIAGAETATLEPGIGAIDPAGGTFEVTVLATTTYLLTATNGAGTTTDEVTIQAKPPHIVSFQSDHAEILLGETATLSWSVEGADLIRIEPGNSTSVEPEGSLVVEPTETTLYTLTAGNVAGSVSAQVAIDVVPFRIVSFTADNYRIEAGEPVTLQWEVVGVASVTLEGYGGVPLVGSLTVQPQSTTTYRLRATNGALVQTRSLVIAVGVAGQGAVYFSWSESEYPGPDPQLQPGIPFEVYVLAIDPQAGILGFEFSLNVPPCVILLAAVQNPPTGINLGGSNYNWIVGTGQCLQGVIVPLLRLVLLAFEDQCFLNGSLGFGPSVPSSFTPAVPGYLTCSEELIPFEVGPDLPLDYIGTPVGVFVQFDAQGEADGVRLHWDLAGSAPSSVTLLRRQGAGAHETIAHFTGAQAGAVGTWLDPSARVDVQYRYQLQAEVDGRLVRSDEIVATRLAMATRTRLLPNRPNPFNPSTELRFYLAEPGDAELHVFDVSGRRVRTLHQEGLTSGEHFLRWDGRDSHGSAVSSGTYVVRLEAGSAVDTRRITLLR